MTRPRQATPDQNDEAPDRRTGRGARCVLNCRRQQFTAAGGRTGELRTETTAGFARLDGRIDDVRTEMHAGFAAQTTALVDLARSVGRVEGRVEGLVAAE